MRNTDNVGPNYLGSGGVKQLVGHVKRTLLSALRRAGSGHFVVRYEMHKVGKFKVFVDGTICQRFYLASEEIVMRLDELGEPQRPDTTSVHGLLTHVERTLLGALDAAGFGHFVVRYHKHDDHTFQVVIDGTERRDFLIAVEDVVANVTRLNGPK